MPVESFIQTATLVAGSASRDETRPVLTGILVSASDHELSMVATDSYRLSVKETTLEEPLSEAFEVNVPARALQELARIAAHAGDAALSISVRQNQVIFELGGVVLSSRLIDGQFPNYRQLLPETFEHELRLAGAELTEVVRRISLLAQKNAPLRLSFGPGELTISAQTPDIGEAREAWRKADSWARQMPAAGAYDRERDEVAVLGEALDAREAAQLQPVSVL